MSKPKIRLIDTTEHFGFASDEFISKIDDAYTKRVVHKLTGDVEIGTFHTPITERYDHEGEDHRLNIILGYMMGDLDLDISELDCGPLLGLYDHKGVLTSFWEGVPDNKYVQSIHDGWNSYYEEQHYAVFFSGNNANDSNTYAVDYGIK
jgi:hypothetical protein